MCTGNRRCASWWKKKEKCKLLGCRSQLLQSLLRWLKHFDTEVKITVGRRRRKRYKFPANWNAAAFARSRKSALLWSNHSLLGLVLYARLIRGRCELLKQIQLVHWSITLCSASCHLRIKTGTTFADNKNKPKTTGAWQVFRARDLAGCRGDLRSVVRYSKD